MAPHPAWRPALPEEQAHALPYGHESWRSWASVLYIAFMFALPARILGTELYAILLIGVSLVYFLANAAQILALARMPAYFWLCVVFGLCLAFSYTGLLNPSGRLFDTGRIIPQSASMFIFLIILPNFMHAAGQACMPDMPVSRIMTIAVIIILSVILWQPDEMVIVGFGLYGAQSAGLMLQLLYFLMVLRTPSPISRAALLLLALPLMLAGTNFGIQLVLIGLVLTPYLRHAIIALASLAVIVILIFAYPPDWFYALLATDANSLVRSQMWHNALSTIMHQPLGIGYGTAWSDEHALKFAALSNAYSHNTERALDVANHNSFIDVALRLGWAGLILFIVLIIQLWRGASRSALVLPAAGMFAMILVAATLNPMLESGRAALIVTFVLAYLRAAGLQPLALTYIDSATPTLPAALSPQERRRQLAGLDHG